MTAPLSLVGTYGSPYSLKMRAVLRYRHIPFTWVLQNTPGQFALPKPPVAIIPVIGFPDETGTVTEVMVDSTPQIARLETMFPERSLVPTDPALAFLHLLIEDYADEWLVRIMLASRQPIWIGWGTSTTSCMSAGCRTPLLLIPRLRAGRWLDMPNPVLAGWFDPTTSSIGYRRFPETRWSFIPGLRICRRSLPDGNSRFADGMELCWPDLRQTGLLSEHPIRG